jgi:hypothetical protein
MTSKLARFNTLIERLRNESPRPDRQSAAFAAVALVHCDGDEAILAASTRTAHQALKEALGGFQAPDGAMRWVYAAMLVANNVEVSHFIAVREALREAKNASKTGSLHAGGSRAALILAMAEDGADISQMVARFFAVKSAVKPPWWRSNVAVTDTFAAAHALTGSTSDQIVTGRARAEAVYASDRRAKHYKRDGARQTVLLEGSPEMVLSRFTALEEARRAHKFLRARSSTAMTMDWANQGRTPEDIAVIGDMVQQMPRALDSTGQARARLATLIAFDDVANNPAGSASALAAVIAAQAAAMAAIMAATVTTTTSAAGTT